MARRLSLLLGLTLLWGHSMARQQKVLRANSVVARTGSTAEHWARLGVTVIPGRAGITGTLAEQFQLASPYSKLPGAFVGWRITVDGKGGKKGCRGTVKTYDPGTGKYTVTDPKALKDAKKGDEYTMVPTRDICLDALMPACDAVMINFEGSKDNRRRANSQNIFHQYGEHARCSIFMYHADLDESEKSYLQGPREAATGLLPECVLPANYDDLKAILSTLAEEKNSKRVFLVFSSHGDLAPKDHAAIAKATEEGNEKGKQALERNKGNYALIAGKWVSKKEIKKELVGPFCANSKARLLVLWSACFSGGMFAHLYDTSGTKIRKNQMDVFSGTLQDFKALEAKRDHFAKVRLVPSPSPPEGASKEGKCSVAVTQKECEYSIPGRWSGLWRTAERRPKLTCPSDPKRKIDDKDYCWYPPLGKIGRFYPSCDDQLAEKCAKASKDEDTCHAELGCIWSPPRGGACPGGSLADTAFQTCKGTSCHIKAGYNVVFITGSFPHKTQVTYVGTTERNLGKGDISEGGNGLHVAFRKVTRETSTVDSKAMTVGEFRAAMIREIQGLQSRHNGGKRCSGKLGSSVRAVCIKQGPEGETEKVQLTPEEGGEIQETMTVKMQLTDEAMETEGRHGRSKLTKEEYAERDHTYNLAFCYVQNGKACEKKGKKAPAAGSVAGSTAVTLDGTDGFSWYPIVTGNNNVHITAVFPFHGTGCKLGRDADNGLLPREEDRCRALAKEVPDEYRAFGFRDFIEGRDPDDCCNSRLMTKDRDQPVQMGKMTFVKSIAAFCREEQASKGGAGAKKPRWKHLGFVYEYECWRSYHNPARERFIGVQSDEALATFKQEMEAVINDMP